MKEIINAGVKFVMGNLYLNVGILVALIGLGWFLWTYRKVQALVLIATVKAEVQKHLKGEQKLDFALKWIMKQNFYKNSILKFVSLKMIKWLINTIFNKNKGAIETK